MRVHNTFILENPRLSFFVHTPTNKSLGGVKVVPSLFISLPSILDSPPARFEYEEESNLNLTGIICFEPDAQHYTAFTRDLNGWFFHDGLRKKVNLDYDYL